MDYLFTVLLSVVFMLGFMLINKLLWNRKGKKNHFDMRSYKYNAYIQLVECGYLIIFMSSIINLEILNAENTLEFIQSILTIVFITFFLFFTMSSFTLIYLNYEWIKDEKRNKIIMEKYGAFWDGIDLEKPFAVYFTALKQIVKLLYVFDLFFFKDAPLLQIYLAVMIQFSYFVLFVYSWPYDTKRGN